MMRILHLSLLATLFCCLPVSGQWRAHVYMNQLGGHWDFPVVTDSVVDMTVSADHRQLLVNVTGGATVPFDIASIDSVAFGLEPAVETKNQYQTFQLYLTTNDGQDIGSRHEYKPCHIVLGAGTSFTSFSANAQVRGRGNSSFLWYDKKPYRLKLDQKHKVLGLDKAKSWVLLANYRDVTDLMNTFAFEMGHALGLPYTNHTRYVELFVNGDYRGLYQLTEQVQQNKNRVAVSTGRGILLSLDVDDGPDEQPDAGDNFYSKVYRMPACVKFPDDEYRTANTTDSVRAVFATLERAIRDRNYGAVKQLLDVPSFIKYLLIQEFVYNVELSAPRSVFLHKDGDGPWVMGPLWDFDGGYDFDWGNMYSGHTYFTSYRETVMGTDPLMRNGQYGYVPQFFTDLFGCPEFVRQYKAQWAEVKDTIVSHCWQECIKYVRYMRYCGAREREAARWPLAGKDFEKELSKMLQWLKNRAAFMSELIANIPEER